MVDHATPFVCLFLNRALDTEGLIFRGAYIRNGLSVSDSVGLYTGRGLYGGGRGVIFGGLRYITNNSRQYIYIHASGKYRPWITLAILFMIDVRLYRYFPKGCIRNFISRLKEVNNY